MPSTVFMIVVLFGATVDGPLPAPFPNMELCRQAQPLVRQHVGRQFGTEVVVSTHCATLRAPQQKGTD